MRRGILLFLAGLAIGELGPLEWVTWRVVAARLPAIKSQSLAAPSPFQSLPHSRWIAESPNAYVIEDPYDAQAPVHLLVIPKQRLHVVTRSASGAARRDAGLGENRRSREEDRRERLPSDRQYESPRCADHLPPAHARTRRRAANVAAPALPPRPPPCRYGVSRRVHTRSFRRNRCPPARRAAGVPQFPSSRRGRMRRAKPPAGPAAAILVAPARPWSWTPRRLGARPQPGPQYLRSPSARPLGWCPRSCAGSPRRSEGRPAAL